MSTGIIDVKVNRKVGSNIFRWELKCRHSRLFKYIGIGILYWVRNKCNYKTRPGFPKVYACILDRTDVKEEIFKKLDEVLKPNP